MLIALWEVITVIIDCNNTLCNYNCWNRCRQHYPNSWVILQMVIITEKGFNFYYYNYHRNVLCTVFNIHDDNK
jgi:hypothetical protein